jgi:four helix bundle suffix protein
MEQCGRSGKQNIAEGYSQESLSSYIYLLGISFGSVKELKEDFEDFLRQRKLQIYPADHEKVREFRSFRAVWDYPNIPNSPNLPKNPEEAANMLLTFCQMLSFLLRRQIQSLEAKFVHEGGFRENLHKKHLEERKK